MANLCSFIREDKTYNYISGLFPPDAALLAEKIIVLVRRASALEYIRVTVIIVTITE